MKRRAPSWCPVTRGSARSLVCRLARLAERLISLRLLGGDPPQPVQIDSFVVARQQRLFGEGAHVVAVSPGAPDDGCFARGLRRAVLASRDPDAGHQSTKVPLPPAGVSLAEVVEVEDQVAFG